MSVWKSHLDRQTSSDSEFEGSRNAFGQTGVERERILRRSFDFFQMTQIRMLQDDVNPPARPPACLSVCLFVGLSVCLSVCLSAFKLLSSDIESTCQPCLPACLLTARPACTYLPSRLFESTDAFKQEASTLPRSLARPSEARPRRAKRGTARSAAQSAVAEGGGPPPP